ncbi:M23 family metallopeptidase [Nocardioides sp.]|uniref:M23 family metallopeptidase n=1 Tax=Nocardioides sp. TaxID=35761 RepID=UPI0031FE4422|nr:Peptidase [Nocardioides sp.]
MGNHRAERRGPRRTTSETPNYTGRRVAGRADTETATVFDDFDVTQELPLLRAQPPGRRKAIRHAGSRGPLFRGLPSAPILLGVAALALSAGGAVTAADPGLVGQAQPRLSQASALTGTSDTTKASNVKTRTATISRDSRRDALAAASDADLVAAAEQQMQERNVALAKLAKQAEAMSAKKLLNQWVLPVSGYHLTARFGDYGLWSTFHTGLDFAAPTGTPIRAVANGVVTSVAYDGSYGNKTVITLDDGTELWFCHQNSTVVNTGDVVSAGDLIGYIGSTGHVTGPHLHLEVRPGGGDPVDPFPALVLHGLNP